MKIAVLGSAPSSVQKAPFGDPSWKIWACSPGCYPHLTRVDEFWEVHRWEPGVVGKPNTQKPWFSPEYVQWLKTVPPVLWVADPAANAECPNSKLFPIAEYVAKFGHYVWTSSVAYMLARAINVITDERLKRAKAAKETGLSDTEAVAVSNTERDVIGLWGVDMAANEELYTSQRAACQTFLQLIVNLGIDIYVPPESDLCTPPPMYGFSEISHKAIKWLERRRELEGRLAMVNQQAEAMRNNSMFLQGAIDDLDYMQKMWMHEGEETAPMKYGTIFPEIDLVRSGRVALKSIEAAPIVLEQTLPNSAVVASPMPGNEIITTAVVDPVGSLDKPDAGIR